MIGKLEFILNVIMTMMLCYLVREMKEIFIEEARKRADVVEERDIMYTADHLEEAIDEAIANLQ
jgi:hypothetical protein